MQCLLIICEAAVGLFVRNVFIGKQIGTYNLDIWVMVIG
jgi:hypothetical protein